MAGELKQRDLYGRIGKGAEGELEVKGPEGSWNGVES